MFIAKDLRSQCITNNYYCMFKYCQYSSFFSLHLRMKPMIKSVLLLLVQSSFVSSREQCRDAASHFCVKIISYECQMHYNACRLQKVEFINGSFPLKPVGKGRVTLFTLLNHVVIVEFGPFKDVLLAHNV